MVIVTGANGFIGSALVWELNQAGVDDIVCVDDVDIKTRPAPLAPLKYTRFILKDDLFSFLNSQPSCDGIFHMGACSSTTELDEEFLRINNTEYTNKIFKHCAEFDVPLIYASSGAVYGQGEAGFSDRDPAENFKPLNPYGWSKLNFDKIALASNHAPKRWYGLRFFNVYGPNEYHKLAYDMCSVVYKAYLQIRSTQSLKLFRSHNTKYPDGGQMRDFVYVKDITRWMLEIWRNPNIENGIYNLGYGEARTWLDLAAAVFAGMACPMDIQWIDIPEGLRERYQYFTEADITKLKSQGLSAPQWSVEEGVADYLKNYLLQQEAHLHA